MENQLNNTSPSFLSNVLKLVSGSIVAQALTILTLPVLSRLFSPDAIGASAIFISITGLIGVLACLRYELSIMLPESDSDAANLFGLSVLSVFIISSLVTISIPFVGGMVINLLNAPLLEKYLYLIPFAVMVNGLFLALNYWNSRTKQFGRLSIARVTASVIHNSVRLGGGLLGFVSCGMLIGSAILGQLATTLVLGAQILRDDGKLFKESVRPRKIFSGMKKHWKFPVFSSWSILFNTLSLQMPSWILAFYFTPAIVGFFALGRMAIGMPMRLIGSAISQVFYQKASEKYAASGDIAEIVENVFGTLVSIGILPFLLVILIGDDLFCVAFGKKWIEAGVYAQLIGPAILFQFIISPLIDLFIVMEKQNIHFFLDFLLLASRLGALIYGGIHDDVHLALMLYAGAGVIYYMVVHIWVCINFKVHLRSMLKPVFKYAGVSLPLILIVATAKWHLAASPGIVVVLGCLAAIFYYAFVLKQYDSLQEPVKRAFQKAGMIK